MSKPGLSKAQWRKLIRAEAAGAPTTLVAASKPAKRRALWAIQKAKRGR